MVKMIACGESHTHLLSDEGFVYSMGSNKDGRLGIGYTY
jgi:alpha-tubulin suppressor-like RCC1 family protein